MNNCIHSFSPITHDDLIDIQQLQPDGWSDIIPDITFYIESVFCSPVKLQHYNSIVGIGASISFGKTCWLAHIIVDSSHRNMGIGLSTVQKLLNDIENKDQRSILLIATDLGEPVYKKVGFRNVSEYARFERERSDSKIASSDNIVHFEENFRDSIYEMDKKVTGEDRTKILTGTLGSSLVYLKGGKMLGYYIPELGDGPIIAETNEAGIELMKIKYASIDKAVIPAENEKGIMFLKENGFKETTTIKRMILGQDIDWKPEQIYSRISGNFG